MYKMNGFTKIPFAFTLLLTIALAFVVVSGLANPALTRITPTDTDGVLVFQANHTNSPLGNWEMVSLGHPDYFEGASNDTMLYFTGNQPNLGPADSPLEFTFIAPETATYELAIRSSRDLRGAANDHCNDFFVRMAGDFEPGHNTFSKSVLTSNTKHYFSSVPDRQWGWTILGERRIDGENVKLRFRYVLKQGEVYTLTVSGRSQRAIMDYIILFNTSKVTVQQARAAQLIMETSPDGSLKIIFDETQGAVTKNPDKPVYDPGEEVVLTAEPEPGFRFSNWTGYITSEENPLTINMDSTIILTANFVPVYTVTISENTVNGTVDISPDKPYYDSGESVTFTPQPASGYSFGSWFAEGGISGNEVPLVISVNRDIDLTAYFNLITYQLFASASNGTIIRNPHSLVYTAGTQVELTAIPNEGYQFTQWSGYVTGEDNPMTITMDSVIYITANFDLISSTHQNEEVKLNIYPNPSEGIFTVKIGESASWNVYNLAGVKLKSGNGSGTFQLDLKTYPKGIYFLEMLTKEGAFHHRLVVE